MTESMRIAVYSGTFNPLHVGHLAIMRLLQSRFDETYLIVSPKNPLKDSISADSGRERWRKAVEAIRRHPDLRVRADDIELRMEPPHYTVRTLDALRRREPDNTFTLAIGADNLADFRRWRDYGRILREYGVAVYPRTGFDLPGITADLLAEDSSYRMDILDAPTVDISSTEIREGLAAGRDMSEWLM